MSTRPSSGPSIVRPTTTPHYMRGRAGHGVLRHPGVNLAADAYVLAVDEHGTEHLALVQRADGSWALPGGRLEDGETPAECAARELAEETGTPSGLVIPAGRFTAPGVPEWVPDPRNTQDAHMATWVCETRYDGGLAPIGAGDGTLDAIWVPVTGGYTGLAAHLAVEYAGAIYPAHTPLLIARLGAGSAR